MLSNKLDSERRSTLAIAGSMSGLWLLGVIALTLLPAAVGSRESDHSLSFRHQASGVTNAYQDVTGQFTVYIRGSQRLLTP